MNAYDKAHELARAIRDSEAYTALKQAKEKVEQDQSALDMLQDFRKRQWELEAKHMTGGNVTESEMLQLEKLAEVIQLNHAVKAYVEAEYRWSILMSDVQRILAESVQDAALPSPFED